MQTVAVCVVRGSTVRNFGGNPASLYDALNKTSERPATRKDPVTASFISRQGYVRMQIERAKLRSSTKKESREMTCSSESVEL